MPKVLFEDPAYKKLSDGGKLLYCVLLNRMGLSKKNEWRDENGKVGTAHNGSTERTGGNTCQNSSFPFSAQGIESEHTIVGRYFHKSNLLSENGKDL